MAERPARCRPQTMRRFGLCCRGLLLQSVNLGAGPVLAASETAEETALALAGLALRVDGKLLPQVGPRDVAHAGAAARRDGGPARRTSPLPGISAADGP